MTPQGTYQDAVDYAKQWRDEERARHAGAERTSIRWPGGPHDFVIAQVTEPAGWPAPLKGWVWLTGLVVEPEEPPQGFRTFHVRPVDGGYELMPLAWR
jgi:hypothetical protein